MGLCDRTHNLSTVTSKFLHNKSLKKSYIKIVISTRRGTWLFNRITQKGLPYDVVYQSRFYDWLMRTVPWSIANDFHEWRMQQRT